MKGDRDIQIFSLSLLDTFCCALGAMILLFIVNSQLLTGSIRDAVNKYKEAAKKAREEAKISEEERQNAIRAKDEATRHREDAITARNAAEMASEKSVQDQRALMIAIKEAKADRESARQAEEKAKDAQKKAEAALQEAEEMRKEAEAARNKVAEKNTELEANNQTLRSVIDDKKNLDKSLKDSLEQYTSLKQKADAIGQEKEKLEAERKKLQKEKDKLQSDIDIFKVWQAEMQQKYGRLQSDYTVAQTKNDDLARSIGDISKQVQEREKNILNRESDVQKYEENIKIREKKIKELEKELERKGEKSLFGIRLTYKRIVFLVDRSGSIVQNSWKQVVIQTCKEILQHCDVDEFAIVAFSSDMSYYPPRKGNITSGSQESKNKAIDWLENKLPFGGATHLHEALPVVYENYDPVDAIFLLSDGLPAARDRTTESLQKEIVRYIQSKLNAKVNTKIITIAIGYPPTNSQEYIDIYKYLHQISDMTGGQYLGR